MKNMISIHFFEHNKSRFLFKAFKVAAFGLELAQSTSEPRSSKGEGEGLGFQRGKGIQDIVKTITVLKDLDQKSQCWGGSLYNVTKQLYKCP